MSVKVFARLRATFFFKLLIVLSLLAAIIMFFCRQVPEVAYISLSLHLLVAAALCWFMMRVVWPIRREIERLIHFVVEHKPAGLSGLDLTAYDGSLGCYAEVVDQTLAGLEKMYENMQEDHRRLENFSLVQEKYSRRVSESRQRYRLTLDALENGLYLIDENYVIRSINRAEAAFHDAHPRDLVGQHCYEVFRHRSKPCSDCLPRLCMADGQARNLQRVAGRRVGRKFVNIYCYPVFHEGDETSHEAVVYIQDTSPLVMMEDKVIRTEKMASIGQMAAGVAHDLNNHLAGIYGVVQIMEMRLANREDVDKERKLISRLKDQVEALNLLAGNLMVFSHPERKEIFPLSLNQVIEDALSFSRYELERGQVSLVLKLAPELPLVVMEKGQIQQVFLNLMLNGAQAIRQRNLKNTETLTARIEVETGLGPENMVYFSVSDNGDGIAAADKGRIFDPFFSTKKVGNESGATGLGLFTARTVVEQHQGRIEFVSTPGQGSCFKVWLPVRPDQGGCLAGPGEDAD